MDPGTANSSSTMIDSPHLLLSPSEREETIIRLVSDPYGYGYRDRVLVDIEGINNRTLIDNYFLKLYDLELQSADSEELKEHKARLQFFQAYYLLTNGYYTEQELKGHPGVLEVVEGMRTRGELMEGEDIEYADFKEAGRERAYSSPDSPRRKEKKRKGLLAKLLGVL